MQAVNGYAPGIGRCRMKRRQKETGEAGAARRGPELVSPAGSAEAGFAALRYGADAV